MTDSLRFDISVPRTAHLGEPVTIVLRLTNVDDHPVDAHLTGRDITFDIVVTDSAGTVVWRRLAGAVVQSILQIRTLAPGETLELRDVWRQRTLGNQLVPADRYTVQGILPGDAREPRRTAAVGLRITPR